MKDRIESRGASIDLHVGKGSTVIVINQTTKGRDVSLDAPLESAEVIDPTLFRAALQDLMQYGAENIDMGRAYGELLVRLRYTRHIFTFREFQEDLGKKLEEAIDTKEGATFRSMPAVFSSFRTMLEEEATEIWTDPQ